MEYPTEIPTYYSPPTSDEEYSGRNHVIARIRNIYFKSLMNTGEEKRLQRLITQYPHRQDLKLQLLVLQRNQQTNKKRVIIDKGKRKKK